MTQAEGFATPFDDAARVVQAAPVRASDRIAAIDVLRGVALLGILVMNIKAFSMMSAAYMNPMALGPLTGTDRVVWLIEHHLFDMKMMTIFSMLFGAGVVLFTDRLERRTGRSAGVHYRRMGWLILFGLLHAHLLWYGDILYTYGMCGLIVYLFRRLPAPLLIVLGLLFMLVLSGLIFGVWASYPKWPPDMTAQQAASWAPSAEDVAREVDAYRGGWLSQASHRSPFALGFQTFGLVFFGWKTIGNMLFGMGLFKLGAFAATWPTRTYLLLIAGGIVAGLPLISFGVRMNEADGWNLRDGMFMNGQYNYWGSLFVAMGWVGLVMLIVKHDALRWLTVRLAAVGQTAFSNYLMHTLICTTIFYGHGFGLYGKLDRLEQELVVLAIWAVQLTVSPIWLRYFQFGPAEWVWRSLTYWKRQPMRRTSALAPAA